MANDHPLTLMVQQRLREYIHRFASLTPSQQEAELDAQLDRLREHELNSKATEGF